MFSISTNQPFGPNPTKANLDTLFGAMNLGTAYSGTWTNAQTLVITIGDATGGTAPIIGTTTFTLQAGGNLKNAAGTSPASVDTSPAITGDWGTLAGPTITSVTADDADNLDGIYGNDDTITFVFSENTNQPFGPNPTQANLNTLFGAMNLGTSYSGNWTNAQTLVITISDATGGTAPTIGVTTYTLQAAGNLKNAAVTSLVSTDTSAAITGDWGTLTGPTITSVTADDPDDADGIYGNDDTITFVFSENTNEPFGPNPTKANLDTMFGAMNLGTTYTGAWTDAQTLVITISDSTGGTAPTIGATTYTLQAAGNLKNAADTSLASTDTSPAITGDWGRPNPIITLAELDSENRFVEITFDKGVYSTVTGTGAVQAGDFTLILNRNGGNAKTVGILSMTRADDSALAGGETVIRMYLEIDGTPVGVETIEIKPETNEIFSAVSAAAADTETTGEITLNSMMVEVKEGEVIIRRNVINPSRGEYTALNFRLKKSTKVNVMVYDLAGNPVKELYNKTAPAGLTEVRWYGKNKRGRKVVVGVYYVVTTIGKKRDMKKVLIVK